MKGHFAVKVLVYGNFTATENLETLQKLLVFRHRENAVNFSCQLINSSLLLTLLDVVVIHRGYIS